MNEYIKRTYRNTMKGEGLTYFKVSCQESDLYIGASENLSKIALKSLKKHRKSIENYVSENPSFKTSLRAIPIKTSMPQIVKDMTEASLHTGIGPMSAVAGVISEYVAKDLALHSEEVIVENGGDIYIMGKKERTAGIFAGKSRLSEKLAIKISPSFLPLAIATSSGTVGPSLSFGKADAVVVLSRSGSLADTVATALGNIVKSSDDFQKAIEMGQNIAGIDGFVIICEEKICIWGGINIIPFKS